MLFFAPFVVLVVLLARRWVGAAFGIEGLRFAAVLEKADYAHAKTGARAAIVATSVVTIYLVASAFVLGDLLVRGRFGSNLVDTIPGRAASAAGVVDGDRIVRMNGQATPDFPAISRITHGAPDKTLDLEIERGGGTVRVSVVADASGKIGVRTRAEPYPFADAMIAALMMPARIDSEAGRELVELTRRRPEAEVVGRLGIVSAASAAPSPGGEWLYVVGAALSFYGLPFAAILSLALLPRRRRDAAA